MSEGDVKGKARDPEATGWGYRELGDASRYFRRGGEQVCRRAKWNCSYPSDEGEGINSTSEDI